MSEGHHVLVVQAEIRKGQKPSVTVGSSLEVTRGGCGAARSRFIFNFLPPPTDKLGCWWWSQGRGCRSHLGPDGEVRETRCWFFVCLVCAGFGRRCGVGLASFCTHSQVRLSL